MKRTILLVIVLIIAVVGWYAYSEYNRTNADLKNKQADFSLPAEQLIESFENDAITANKKFVDRIIAVNGKVKKIEASENPVIVFLGETTKMSSVQCSMDSVHANDYKNLKEGDVVTIKGMVNGAISDEMFGTDVKLNRCILQVDKKNKN